MKSILWAVVLFVVINMPQVLYGYPAEVRDISNRDYTDAVIEALTNADTSIYMVMYLISYKEGAKDSNVYRLLEGLRNAHQRGVKVAVILDYRSSGEEKEGSVSYYAYKFLKDAGINVVFDTPAVYTHNKTIVIDGNIIISGSANWSQAALARNNETNFIIDSPGLAEDIIARFKGIKLIEEKDEGKVPGVFMPRILLKKEGILQDMARRGDNRSFDIYLLMLAGFEPGRGGEIDITYEEMAEGIGMERKDYRDMTNRTLRKLQDRYKLIKAKMHYGAPAAIILLDPGTGNLLNKMDGKQCLKIPDGYWDYGWSQRLNLAEKYCWLINLAEMPQQTKWNEWLLTREQIAGKYGISEGMISKGMMGLRRYGIIDIEYSEIDKGYENRMPALTRFKGLYNYNQFTESIRELEEEYGKELVTQAREYAEVVFRGYDPASIKDVIGFMNDYGTSRVDKAFSKVGMKAIDNPKRAFKYVVGILQKEGAVLPDRK